MSPGQEWPHGNVDLAALTGAGWRPTALREFILKVHQRCNLACDYCYVYTLADQTWLRRPKLMSREVWQAAAARIAEHVTAHALTEITVVLHGGEPTLAGEGRLLELLTDVRAAVPRSCAVHFGMQTNGVRLHEPMLAVMRAFGVRIGVSLDGPPAENDRHRRYADGRGSSTDVERTLRRLGSPADRSLFAGLLCTVDPDTDPVACYEGLIRYRPEKIDFLLPHANWSVPPHRPGPLAHGSWLARIFDRWYDAPVRETSIRIFEEIINLYLGGTSRSEQVGLSPSAVIVVESDGAIEQTDALKSAYDNRRGHRPDRPGEHLRRRARPPGRRRPAVGVRALCATCRDCRIRDICGAGHYAHRFGNGNGFLNPTVYCADMVHLIDHITSRVAADLRRLEVA